MQSSLTSLSAKNIDKDIESIKHLWENACIELVDYGSDEVNSLITIKKLNILFKYSFRL
jgi:hypothetical protein